MTDRLTRIEREPAGAAVAPMNADQQRWLRQMMARFATGVTVVAARHGPLLAGMTANAIASFNDLDAMRQRLGVDERTILLASTKSGQTFEATAVTSGCTSTRLETRFVIDFP